MTTPFKRTTQVTSLPPTIGIKDPEVRAFLDAMVNAWDLRSGVTNGEDKERFVTLGEIRKLTNKALVKAFSRGGVPLGKGAGTGGNPTEEEINDLIDNLADSIRKSILYQLLGTYITPVDLTNLRAKIDAAIGEVGAKIIEETEIRSSADEAFINDLRILVGRIEGAEAAIASEQTVRVTKDNALASAINTMWAQIGSNQAVIQDGQLAAVTPSATQATKWNQVVASVTDPNTGQVNSASIKQELNAYANQANGTFNAIYSVRAQVDRFGRTIIGGFGLAATTGAGSAQGPTIDFGVRADTFFIASPASTPTLDSQLDPSKNDIPFIVVTNTQHYGGVLYRPGVYMKTAMIADATIGTAKIADASITNAKIQNASIDNAKIRYAAIDTALIAGGSVTSMNYASGSSGTIAGGSSALVTALSIDMPAGSTGVALIGNCNLIGAPDSGTAGLEIRRNGVSIAVVGVSFVGSFQSTFLITEFDASPSLGSNVYTFHLFSPSSGAGSNKAFNYVNVSLMATGGKR